MVSQPVKTASIRFPAEPTIRRVWVGSYGGHFSVVVVFKSKPNKGKKGAWNEGEYCTLENRDLLIGSFDEDQFNEWFGTAIEADETDILKVEPYDLTAIWDSYGNIVGLNTDYDGNL